MSGDFVASMSGRVNPSLFSIAAATSLAADGAPSWIRLIPAGTFQLRDGRGPFDAGDKSAMEAIVARSLAYAGQTELMLDYDHQSVFGAIPNVGGQAPAAGWVKRLEARDDGIWAQVEWTDAAAEKIRAGEYRYISPLFTSSEDGRIGRIVNAALVNMPAIDSRAIAAALAQFTEKDPDMKNIAKALGLEDNASEAAIIAAIGVIATAAGLKADAKLADVVSAVTALVAGAGTIAVAAGLKAGATAEEIVAAMAKTGGDTVPKASFDKLSADFNALKTSVTSGEVERVVSAAIKDGKVTPANKKWATDYATRDLAGFNDFVANAPTLTAAQLGDDAKVEGAETRSAEEIAAAARLYQDEQGKLGFTVSISQAVDHVTAKKK